MLRGFPSAQSGRNLASRLKLKGWKAEKKQQKSSSLLVAMLGIDAVSQIWDNLRLEMLLWYCMMHSYPKTLSFSNTHRLCTCVLHMDERQGIQSHCRWFVGTSITNLSKVPTVCIETHSGNSWSTSSTIYNQPTTAPGPGSRLWPPACASLAGAKR